MNFPDQKSGGGAWLLLAIAWLSMTAAGAAAQESSAGKPGFENQRRADLGDGRYLNPVLAGDRPDPTVLKDGEDYYMTHSSFRSYPGLLVWHSKDLVNWEPVGPALRKNIGDIWAPDLVKHRGRYYLYFPALKDGRTSNYVVWAERIQGPWSEPIDLKVGQIDPGHAVGPDGRRYLFLSGGHLVPLADDGLSIAGALKKIYDGWQYPADWIVTGFALEGPKIARRGDYYHMLNAQGGTAGPPTSHMVVSARAGSPDGPWENSPHNPIVRTWSRDEKWWSKGHATLVEGPDGKDWLVYHAYENGFYTLGRQTLLEPVVWTDDGWFKAAGYDVARPIPKPAGGAAVVHGLPFSDDFSTDKIGVQWAFHDPAGDYSTRYRLENNSLVLQGQGQSPADCSPLTFLAGDQAYQMEVEIEIADGARAGLILFYNEKLYAGLGFDREHFFRHRYGTDKTQLRPKNAAQPGTRLWLRLVNDRHVVSLFHSADGHRWSRYGEGMEVSGYHHNVAGGFVSLRPALYAAGRGEVRFRNFRYQALP